MPSVNNVQTKIVRNSEFGGYPHTVVQSKDYRVWGHSPRVNGHLRLRSNGHTRERFTNLEFVPRGPAALDLPTSVNAFAYITPGLKNRLGNEVRARLRGRLYKGSAALGITFAELKATRQMVNSRYTDLINQADTAHRVMSRLGQNPKTSASKLGSTYLEYLFGWAPLVSDIVASVSSVVQKADYLDYVRSSATQKVVDYDRVRWNGSDKHVTINANVRMTYAAGVRIRNPNLWLAERFGVLNPASIAWDIVPWSWVVNMFVNVNSLVQQVTDFAGLDFVDGTLTEAVEGYQTSMIIDAMQRVSRASYRYDFKRRYLEPLPPTPRLEFRMPDVSWDLAATAAALFSQKLGALSHIAKSK